MVNLKMHVPMKHNFAPQPLLGRPGTPSYTVNHAVNLMTANKLRKVHRDGETKRSNPMKLKCTSSASWATKDIFRNKKSLRILLMWARSCETAPVHAWFPGPDEGTPTRALRDVE